MKLNEQEIQEFAAHLRCPSGEGGIRIAEMMNESNANIIRKAIGSLNLVQGDSILEIGPGNGAHVNALIKEAPGLTYNGIDISETMVDEANKKFSGFNNVSFSHTNGETIPFETAIFDKAFTTNTIYFWPKPEQYTLEISRVLKPGGQLSLGFIPKSTMEKIPFSKYGFTMYEQQAVKKLLEENGFTITGTINEKEFITGISGEQIEREITVIIAEKQ